MKAFTAHMHPLKKCSSILRKGSWLAADMGCQSERILWQSSHGNITRCRASKLVVKMEVEQSHLIQMPVGSQSRHLDHEVLTMHHSDVRSILSPPVVRVRVDADPVRYIGTASEVDARRILMMQTAWRGVSSTFGHLSSSSQRE